MKRRAFVATAIATASAAAPNEKGPIMDTPTNRLAINPGITHCTMFADPRPAATARGFLEA